MEVPVSIGAVVLAAGQSTRMGRPKLTLPWGEHTVIEQVVAVLREAGITDIIVVTGGDREEIEAVLEPEHGTGLKTIFNPHYRQSEMLVSLQTGVQVLRDEIKKCQALLVVLGDQPEIDASIINAVIDIFLKTGKPVVIPSYHMRRGHPWLVARRLWDQLLSVPLDQTMRDFLLSHGNDVSYAEVDSPAILKDLDTPEDYRRSRNNLFP